MFGLCRIFHCHVSFLGCFSWKHDHLKKAPLNHKKNRPQGATQVAYLVGRLTEVVQRSDVWGVVYRKPWEPTFSSFLYPIHLGFKTFVFHGFWGPKVVVRDELSYLLDRFEQMGFWQMVKRLHWSISCDIICLIGGRYDILLHWCCW